MPFQKVFFCEKNIIDLTTYFFSLYIYVQLYETLKETKYWN